MSEPVYQTKFGTIGQSSFEHRAIHDAAHKRAGERGWIVDHDRCLLCEGGDWEEGCYNTAQFRVCIECALAVTRQWRNLNPDA